jgi:hypothetical protein
VGNWCIIVVDQIILLSSPVAAGDFFLDLDLFDHGKTAIYGG